MEKVLNLPFFLTPFQVSVLLIVSIYSTAFHIVFGSKRFIVCALVGAVAFLVGHLAAERLFSEGLLLFGNVRLVEASLLSWAAMIVTRRFVK